MSRYSWEPTGGISGRYRDTQTGRFVSSQVIRRELDTYLANTDTAAKALADALRNKQLSLVDWELAMRRHIKSVHINAIALERGGFANMRPSDWGRVGQIIRQQYGYLSNFAVQIADGTQRLDGTLPQRAKLYTQAGRTSYYQSAHANRKPELTHVRSIRGKTDSCWECIDLDHKWFLIGDAAYKLPGDRVCNKNCGCSEEMAALGPDGEYVSAGAI